VFLDTIKEEVAGGFVPELNKELRELEERIGGVAAPATRRRRARGMASSSGERPGLVSARWRRPGDYMTMGGAAVYGGLAASRGLARGILATVLETEGRMVGATRFAEASARLRRESMAAGNFTAERMGEAMWDTRYAETRRNCVIQLGRGRRNSEGWNGNSGAPWGRFWIPGPWPGQSRTSGAGAAARNMQHGVAGDRQLKRACDGDGASEDSVEQSGG